MTPPSWLDDAGRPVPTYPCFTCGEFQAGGVYSGQVLRMWGWRPPLTTTAVGHCGHFPIPIGDGRWRLIPVRR